MEDLNGKEGKSSFKDVLMFVVLFAVMVIEILLLHRFVCLVHITMLFQMQMILLISGSPHIILLLTLVCRHGNTGTVFLL